MDWEKTILPRGDEESPGFDPALRTAHWMPQAQVRAALGSKGFPTGKSPIILGYSGEGRDKQLVSFDDDRHAAVLAGSRGGKSESFLVPNLLSYPGSVIVTDLKGELAAITARYRAEVLKQNVIVIDPFRVLLSYGRSDIPLGTYNPLEWMNPHDQELLDEAALIADAIVVKESREPHFAEAAKAYVKAAILYLFSGDHTGPVDLTVLRHLLMTGVENRGIQQFLGMMVKSPAANGAMARSASMIFNMGDRELGSVISTTGRNTEFLDSYGVSKVLTGASSFDPRMIKNEPTSLYIVVPEWRLGSYHRLIRLLIMSLLSHLQRAPTFQDKPKTLFLIDEFPALGHMEELERATAYIASFGVRMAFIVQDLNQLAATYGRDRWQSFVANSGVIMAFANADMMTAEYLSKRCGETEVLKLKTSFNEQQSKSRTSGGLFRRIEAFLSGHGIGGLGHQSNQTGSSNTSNINPEMVAGPLITPDEVMVHFARETGAAMVLINGARPIRLERIRYWDDPLFKDRAGPSPFHRHSAEDGS